MLKVIDIEDKVYQYCLKYKTKSRSQIHSSDRKIYIAILIIAAVGVAKDADNHLFIHIQNFEQITVCLAH